MTFSATLRFIVLFSVFLVPSFTLGQGDWSRWRGPEGNGIAVSQKPPIQWSEENNVIWKVKVPGRGHASPIVVNDKIFLATADEAEKTQSVVCFNRANGKQMWQTEVSRDGFDKKIHRKNTHASSTVATDGQFVFVVFSHHGGVHVSALDFDGKEIWTKKTGVYQSRYPFGYGASPIIYRDNVIVTNENDADSAIVAYDVKTGDQSWKINQKGNTSYSTPVVTTVAGKEQLLLSGGRKVSSFDPANGDQQWSTPANWDVTCGTMVWDGEMVFASGGYPAGQTLGINARTGKKVWDNSAKVYEQSMLVVDGYIYAHSDNGVIYCWRTSDGKEMWKQKFSSRRVAVSASPVLANGNIYFTAENGETAVVKATHEGYQEVGRNMLGDEGFASQAFCGNRIFARVAESGGGSRQEWLYCLGEK